MELDDLFEMRRNVEDRISNFFGDDENPHYGDRGYQDLLEEADNLTEQIRELMNEESLKNEKTR